MELDPNALLTESDVEQKFLYPLLNQILGYFPEEIKTKTYLAPTDIDKGAGKKVGYYPDYVAYLSGLPIVVIEAKDKSINVDAGFREASLYAHELNKRFPPELNPISYVVASNGLSLKYGRWDSEQSAIEVPLSDLFPGSTALARMTEDLGRKRLQLNANALRTKLSLSNWNRALGLVGGPSRQVELIAANSFANDLTPILRKYFDPDDAAISEEILRQAYVSSNEVTEYESTLRALLKERIPNQRDVTPVDTSKRHAEKFDEALKKAVRDKREVPDPLILIVGGVGAGKSMFLDRYFRYLVPEELTETLIQLKVNFNKATDSLDGVETWICKEICNAFEEKFGESFHDNANLKRYFASDINALERGPLDELKAYPDKAAELRANKLLEWHSDPQKLAFSAIRFHSAARDVPVVVTFDNVDRRDRDQQLKVFQTVQWFKAQARCMCILSLRDETFDAFRNQPPLDAFLKPFAFRITAPRFVNVIKKRLQLAIEFLGTRANTKLTYELKNGMKIEYPATNLGRYLLALYVSVFDQSRKIGLILEAISGRDTRRGLEMFTEILRSGYFPEELIFSITEGKGRSVPEWLIIRILMRTSYRFFSSRRGYIANILDFDENGKSGNCFLAAEILEYLAQRRKQVFAFSIEGYLQVESIMEPMAGFGYAREDVLSCMSRLLERGLIVADHQKLKGLAATDYVKITASGYYHLRFLSTRWEYLSNIAFDTPLLGYDAAKAMSRYQEDSKDHASARIDLLTQNLNQQVKTIGISIPEFGTRSNAYVTLKGNVNKAISFSLGDDRSDNISEQGSLDL
jgi:GTPase SAR1 family protein